MNEKYSFGRKGSAVLVIAGLLLIFRIGVLFETASLISGFYGTSIMSQFDSEVFYIVLISLCYIGIGFAVVKGRLTFGLVLLIPIVVKSIDDVIHNVAYYGFATAYLWLPILPLQFLPTAPTSEDFSLLDTALEPLGVVAIAVLLFMMMRERTKANLERIDTPQAILQSDTSQGDVRSAPVASFSNSSSFQAIPRTSGTALAAFILSFFVCFLGLILGYVARREIDNSRGTIGGRGLATAAIVIGWLWTAGIVIWIIIIATAASRYSSY